MTTARRRQRPDLLRMRGNNFNASFPEQWNYLEQVSGNSTFSVCCFCTRSLVLHTSCTLLVHAKKCTLLDLIYVALLWPTPPAWTLLSCTLLPSPPCACEHGRYVTHSGGTMRHNGRKHIGMDLQAHCHSVHKPIHMRQCPAGQPRC